MGRSAANTSDETKSIVEITTLDDEIASILTAIEGEAVPENLTRLALELQEALVERRRRQTPN